MTERKHCQCGQQDTCEWVAFHAGVRHEAFLCNNCQEEWKNLIPNMNLVNLQRFNFRPISHTIIIDTTKETEMTKNLYLVQDSDRPMHVIATSWQNAIDRWEVEIRLENDMEEDELVEPPTGIFLVAKEGDLII